MTTLDTTPRADGFRMPAEWEPHARTWMLWPERPDNWRLGAKPAQAAFVAVAHAIARFEPVTVGVSAAQYENACARLDHPAIRVLELSSDDAWVRDTGPTFVVDARGAVRGVDWTFNAWGGFAGGLYWPWQRDDQLARKILAVEGCARYRTEGFVLEGGAIHVDGEGTLITTEECLLNRNRNPDLDRAAIEAMLAEHLAVDTVIWLPHGLYNDETDGHVDNFCCFVRPGEVLLAWTDDERDPNWSRCRAALAVLERSRDARRRAGADRPPHADPRPAVRQRRGVRRGRLGGRQPAARSVDPPGRLLRQLPDRQRRHRRAELRRPPRCRGRGAAAPAVPRARGGDGAGPRDPSSAAATSTASPSSSRRRNGADKAPAKRAGPLGEPAPPVSVCGAHWPCTPPPAAR